MDTEQILHDEVIVGPTNLGGMSRVVFVHHHFTIVLKVSHCYSSKNCEAVALQHTQAINTIVHY